MPTRNRDMPADLGPVDGVNDYGDKVRLSCTGESKRERAARSAMQGILANQRTELAVAHLQESGEVDMDGAEIMARMAVSHADALFDELDKDKR